MASSLSTNKPMDSSDPKDASVEANAEIQSNDQTTLKDRLRVGDILKLTESLYSPSKEFRLILQDDGNLVLYQEGQMALWSSGTTRQQGIEKAVVQKNGNFALQDNESQSWWDSSTTYLGYNDTTLIIQNDGNVVLVSNGEVIWSTKTKKIKPRTKEDRLEVGQVLLKDQELISPNRKLRLSLQNDGNLVLFYDKAKLWATKTGNSKSNVSIVLVLQEDGQAVLSIDGRAEWTSAKRSEGDSSSILLLKDDGNLTISSSGKEIWSSNTSKFVTKPRTKTDRLEVGQCLWTDDFLVSPNGKFQFTLERNGQFVLSEGQRSIWKTPENDRNPVVRAIMQDDGAFVHFTGNDYPRWSSGTEGRGNASSTLILQDDGNALIVSDGKEIWTTGTQQRTDNSRLNAGDALYYGHEVVSPNKLCKLTMQSDGDLVLYEGGNRKWASDTTRGVSPKSANLNHDDSLSVGINWDNNTRRRPGGGKAVLTVTDKGDVLIESDGLIIWSTNPILIQAWEPLGVTPAAPDSDSMVTGQYLGSNQKLTSLNRLYSLTILPDGNCVVQRNGTSDVLWTTKITANGAVTKLCLGWNNNLALYGPNSSKLWSADSKHREECTLVMKNNGTLSLHRRWGNTMIWSS